MSFKEEYAAKLAELEGMKRKEEARRELAFKQALVALYNEFGMSLEAGGSEGARLEFHEITHTFTIDMLDW